MSYDPGDDPATSDAVAAGPGHRRDPRGRVRPPPLVPGGDGPAHGGRGARPARVHRGRPGRRDGRGPTAPRSGWSSAAGGVLSPIADDGDGVSLAEHLDPDRVVLVADAGLGTINAVRLSVGVLDRLAGDRGAQPLRPARRPPPPQPGLAGRPRPARRGDLGRAGPAPSVDGLAGARAVVPVRRAHARRAAAMARAASRSASRLAMTWRLS